MYLETPFLIKKVKCLSKWSKGTCSLFLVIKEILTWVLFASLLKRQNCTTLVRDMMCKSYA